MFGHCRCLFGVRRFFCWTIVGPFFVSCSSVQYVGSRCSRCSSIVLRHWVCCVVCAWSPASMFVPLDIARASGRSCRRLVLGPGDHSARGPIWTVVDIRCVLVGVPETRVSRWQRSVTTRLLHHDLRFFFCALARASSFLFSVVSVSRVVQVCWRSSLVCLDGRLCVSVGIFFLFGFFPEGFYSCSISILTVST